MRLARVRRLDRAPSRVLAWHVLRERLPRRWWMPGRSRPQPGRLGACACARRSARRLRPLPWRSVWNTRLWMGPWGCAAQSKSRERCGEPGQGMWWRERKRHPSSRRPPKPPGQILRVEQHQARRGHVARMRRRSSQGSAAARRPGPPSRGMSAARGLPPVHVLPTPRCSTSAACACLPVRSTPAAAQRTLSSALCIL
jgi:hypothetical protein